MQVQRSTFTSTVGPAERANVTNAKSGSSTQLDAASSVTFSAEARELASGSQTAQGSRTATQVALLDAIKDGSVDELDQLAEWMAFTPSRVVYDISQDLSSGRMQGRRLASTGQLVGEEFAGDFERYASGIDSELKALYVTEKARGTDPFEIIAKIVDFKNAQSERYRQATAWGYR